MRCALIVGDRITFIYIDDNTAIAGLEDGTPERSLISEEHWRLTVGEPNVDETFESRESAYIASRNLKQDVIK